MKYIIYGHNECQFCDKAKQHLDSLSIPYHYMNIREDDAAMKFVKETLGKRTVPQILKLVGGYEELIAQDDEDSLFD